MSDEPDTRPADISELVRAFWHLVVDARNDWIPDPAHLVDLTPQAQALNSFATAWRASADSTAAWLEVPKAGQGVRFSPLLPPIVRLAYQAYAVAAAHTLPTQASYSAVRQACPNDVTFLVSPTRQWRDFIHAQSELLRTNAWLGSVDIQNCFERIHLRDLALALGQAYPEASAPLARCAEALIRWTGRERGVPQNIMASSFLVDRYLETILAGSPGPNDAIRYMDDVFLGASSREPIERWQEIVASRLAQHGLALNPDKTVAAPSVDWQMSSTGLVTPDAHDGGANAHGSKVYKVSVVRACATDPSTIDLEELIRRATLDPYLVDTVARTVATLVRGNLEVGPLRSLSDLLNALPFGASWARYWCWRAIAVHPDRDQATEMARARIGETASEAKITAVLLYLGTCAPHLAEAPARSAYDRATTWYLRRASIVVCRGVGIDYRGAADGHLAAVLDLRRSELGTANLPASAELTDGQPASDNAVGEMQGFELEYGQ